MTPAQEDALNKLQDIVREHFDSGIIIVESDDTREMFWHGGISNAIGQCEVAKIRLIQRIQTENEN